GARGVGGGRQKVKVKLSKANIVVQPAPHQYRDTPQREQQHVWPGSGSMTSWDWTSLLLLMLLNIDLSEQGCIDYLNHEGMKEISLLRLVPLIKAKDDNNSTNAIICTLKNECRSTETNATDKNICCNLLNYCIYMESDKGNSSDTPECEGKSGLKISLYHLTCLTAEIFFSMTKGEYKDDTYEAVFRHNASRPNNNTATIINSIRKCTHSTKFTGTRNNTNSTRYTDAKSHNHSATYTAAESVPHSAAYTAAESHTNSTMYTVAESDTNSTKNRAKNNTSTKNRAKKTTAPRTEQKSSTTAQHRQHYSERGTRVNQT
ncbi:hypothetical protein INR49_032367, partial [Caranx melampygus]